MAHLIRSSWYVCVSIRTNASVMLVDTATLANYCLAPAIANQLQLQLQLRTPTSHFLPA